MKTIEQALKNEYREALSKCKFSDKRRLYKLFKEDHYIVCGSCGGDNAAAAHGSCGCVYAV